MPGARSPARSICKNDQVALFYGGTQTRTRSERVARSTS